MNWIFLALLAPFIYAVNVLLDKYLIGAKIPDYRSLPIFSSILAIPFIIILSIFGGFEILSLKNFFLIVLTGVLTIWAFSLYLEALIKEETSIIIILIQLIPVFVLGLSYLILGESLSSKQFIGFLLLLVSSILISIKKEKAAYKFSRGLVYMIIADILWAIPYVLIKFASNSISFQSLVVYESIGVVLGGIFLYLFIGKIRSAFLSTIKSIKRPVLGLVFFNECLFLLGKILTYLAVVLGPAALVSILGSTQIFYGIFFGLIMTLILPKVFEEDLSKSALLKKTFFGIMAFAGIILVS